MIRSKEIIHFRHRITDVHCLRRGTSTWRRTQNLFMVRPAQAVTRRGEALAAGDMTAVHQCLIGLDNGFGGKWPARYDLSRERLAASNIGRERHACPRAARLNLERGLREADAGSERQQQDFHVCTLLVISDAPRI